MSRVWILLTLVLPGILWGASTHLPLELTLKETQSLLTQLKKTKALKVQTPEVNKAIKGGEKLLNWINKINQTRDESQKLRLTSKSSQRGIPLDKPKKYGPSTLKRDLEEIRAQIPKAMDEIIYGKKPIAESTIIAEKDFIDWGRKISRLYQTSVRWTSLSGWLDYYEAKKAKDVRGYYYLKSLNDLDKILSDIRGLEVDELKQLTTSLVGLCENNLVSQKKCQKELDRLVKSGNLLSYKTKYWNGGERNWESFFKITDPRRDVVWSETAPGTMTVTFKDPKKPEVANWLKENIEDEFRLPLENWRLEMKFVRGGWSTAYIEFRKNVTPHVSGGNKIVMDANTDIQEYGVRWTIRHEYGHILRLPDCYHEFYDAKEKVMINYQLDVTDLMCSRAGVMNERIYKELKRVYLK